MLCYLVSGGFIKGLLKPGVLGILLFSLGSIVASSIFELPLSDDE